MRLPPTRLLHYFTYAISSSLVHCKVMSTQQRRTTQDPLVTGRFLFLGTGASSGVPVIGCSCAVCTSSNKKNRRLRASAYISFSDKHLLVDAGPDIRQQALLYKIRNVDALLLTHTHYDHIGGLEEMRVFNFLQQKTIPCFLSRESELAAKKLFYYLFEKGSKNGRAFTAALNFHKLKGRSGKVVCEGLEVEYFGYSQGHMQVTGYRFGDLAYVTDIKHYDKKIFDHLQGLSTLIISALRFIPAPLQFTVDEAIDFAKKAGAKKTYLMHLSHEVEYKHLQTLLPESFFPAYDGLEIPFEAQKA